MLELEIEKDEELELEVDETSVLALWGDIGGNINNQADLIDILGTEVLQTEAQNLKGAINELKNSGGTAYRFKGTVETLDDLPTDAEVGDVYFVESENKNYAWTGTEWNAIGGSIDLSLYQKKNDEGLNTESKYVVGAINELLSKTSAVLRFKGSVENRSELPTDAQVGHTYYLQDEEIMTSWKGDGWSDLGSIGDLSLYQTILDLGLETTSKEIVGAINELNTNKANATDLDNYVEKEEGKSLISEEDIEQIGTNKDNIETLDTNKADKSTTYTKNETNDLLDAKVDKVEGKGLSTNDYTDEEQEKLEGIEDGANVNVQADWNETGTTSDSYIKNKPNLSVYSLISETGKTIDLEINSSTYELVAKLYDKNGDLLSTSSVIDLPLESVIVNVEYVDTTEHPKSLKITLKNGTITYVPIGSIITGLATQTYVDNAVSDEDEAIKEWANARFVIDDNYVHTDNNFTTTEKTKLANLENYDDSEVKGDIADLQDLKADKTELPTKTSDLTNDSNFVSDSNYVHTDNNYTTTEKNKLAGLENYDDTEVKEDIAALESGKQDTLISGTNIKTINGESVLGSGDIEITSDPTIIDVEDLPTTDIDDNILYRTNNVLTHLLKRYSPASSSVVPSNTGCTFNGGFYPWAQIASHFDTFSSYFIEDEEGDIYRYELFNEDIVSTERYSMSYHDSRTPHLFYHNNSKWYLVDDRIRFDEVTILKNENGKYEVGPLDGAKIKKGTLNGNALIEESVVGDDVLKGGSVGEYAVNHYQIALRTISQTLTNKTMSGNDNTFSNIKLSSLQNQGTDKEGKLLKVQSDGSIGLGEGGSETIIDVEDLPTTDINDNVIYRTNNVLTHLLKRYSPVDDTVVPSDTGCTIEGTFYEWDRIANAWSLWSSFFTEDEEGDIYRYEIVDEDFIPTGRYIMSYHPYAFRTPHLFFHKNGTWYLIDKESIKFDNTTIVKGSDGKYGVGSISGSKIQNGTLNGSALMEDTLNGRALIDGSVNKYKVNSNQIALRTDAQTLTNKTMSGANNTFSNIPQSAVSGLPEALAGITKSYVIDSEDDITGTKGSDGNYTNVTAITGIDLTKIKLGEEIYIKDTSVSDYWISQITPSISLNALSSKTDLTNYYNKTEINTLLEDKVEKEDGKGLSSNDYTTSEKTKLAGLENYDDTDVRSLITTETTNRQNADNLRYTKTESDNLFVKKVSNANKVYGTDEDGEQTTYNISDLGAEVDNITIEKNSSNKLQVKNGGISLSKLANMGTEKAGKIFKVQLDGTVGLQNESAIAIDNTTIDYNADNQLQVKGGAITNAKINNSLKETNVDENSTNDQLTTGLAVYKERIDDELCSFNLDTSGTTDILKLKLKNVNEVEVFNKQVNLGDKLAYEGKAQTFINKTIDGESNTLTNIPQSSIANTISITTLSTPLTTAQINLLKNNSPSFINYTNAGQTITYIKTNYIPGEITFESIVDGVQISADRLNLVISSGNLTRKSSTLITPNSNITLTNKQMSGASNTFTDMPVSSMKKVELTKEEWQDLYDADELDENTFYIITNPAPSKQQNIIDLVYRVGCIYPFEEGCNPNNLIELENTIWEEVEAGIFLSSAGADGVGLTELQEELPNVKGAFSLSTARTTTTPQGEGAYQVDSYTSESNAASGNDGRKYRQPFDLSKGQTNEDGTYKTESAYKDGGVVRPHTILMHYWLRLA